MPLVGLLGVELEHVLHARDEFGVDLPDAPHLFLSHGLSLQSFFRVTPPTVHRMVIELERRGLIRRTPRQARSIELCVAAEEIPRLRVKKLAVSKELNHTQAMSAHFARDRELTRLATGWHKDLDAP